MASRRGGEPRLIPARRAAVRVRRGRRVRVINTHGYQVVDSWACKAHAIHELMSMERTRPSVLKLTPAARDVLRSNRRRAVLTLTEDTNPGVHDTAACNSERYRMLGVKGAHADCEQNLALALAEPGREPPEVSCPSNLFQNTRYHPTRGLEFEPPRSRPGQHVEFRAEMDASAVFSARPMDVLPINRDGPTDAHFLIL